MDSAQQLPAAQPALARPQESRHERRQRHAHRSRLYLYAILAAMLIVSIAALVIANNRSVTVSWVFGSTRQPLVWVVLATAALSWLLGILTSVLFRYRTRAPRPSRAAPPV